ICADNIGSTTGSLGIPAGYVTETVNVSYKNNINALVQNATGSVVARRNDDLWTELTVAAVITTSASIMPGQTFYISGSYMSLTKFICDDVTINESNKDYAKAT